MYFKRTQEKDESLKKIAIYPVIFSVLMLFSWYYFLWPEARWYYAREQVYFLIFSVGVLLLVVSIRKFLVFFLKGKGMELAGNAIIILGTGLAAFLFFYFVSESENLKNASSGMILLSIAVIIYKLKDFYKSNIYSESIVIAVSYIIAGITVDFMYNSLFSEFFMDLDGKYSINAVLMLSFISLSLIQLISLIDITGDLKLVKISMWLKKNHLLKFMIISGVLFILLDVRRIVLANNVMFAWILVFVVLLVVFILLVVKLRSTVKKEPDVKLKKHLQRITYDKIRDISNISAYVDDFISTGKKSGLTSYLFYMAYKVEIPVVTASKIIAPVLEYKDIEVSEVMSKKSYSVIKERNKQNRTRVIEYVTNNLEFYGRGKHYEYRTVPSIKPKNN
ncbi:hypothetical protein RBH29_15700 [Herbivorax sp. ANBcel31]|uniref:hypothetical protein n=1 Tax=Herbivorax sp. ANBcel31 TaxID=3069754 RepID=UPI0027B3B95E|nr:hypothetical protein [Herbivorax sp. ANBcel31]MDQ2087875.1 hypothetical protein [Herbivorax sp. ANBcel31]